VPKKGSEFLGIDEVKKIVILTPPPPHSKQETLLRLSYLKRVKVRGNHGDPIIMFRAKRAESGGSNIATKI
jgi:hypothetical protein